MKSWDWKGVRAVKGQINAAELKQVIVAGLVGGPPVWVAVQAILAGMLGHADRIWLDPETAAWASIVILLVLGLCGQMARGKHPEPTAAEQYARFVAETRTGGYMPPGVVAKIPYTDVTTGEEFPSYGDFLRAGKRPRPGESDQS